VTRHRPVAGCVVSAFAIVLSTPALHAQASGPAAILAAAASYLQQFALNVDGLVMEEDYFQQAQGQALNARQLKSDYSVLGDASVGWIEFRDTFEVDGKAVRDRQTRVVDLFAHPSPNALEQARRIVREGARFNLTPAGFALDRTINLPMSALYFLRGVNQHRSTFTVADADRVSGRVCTVVDFHEAVTPPLIGTSDNALASGRFCIEAGSGRVLRSELRLKSRRGNAFVSALIRVEYADVPTFHLWLPKRMDETYNITNATSGTDLGTMYGRANYSKFRRFNVAVEEEAEQ
jgi:hypothetical protein